MYAYFADTLAKLEYKGVVILWKVAPVQTGSPAEHRSWAWVPFSKNLFALTMNAKCSLDKAGRWGNEVTIFILLKQLLPVLLYKFKNIQLVNSGALLLSWLSPPPSNNVYCWGYMGTKMPFNAQILHRTARIVTVNSL